MSDFPPPFDPPSLDVPYPPPEVGEGSPWAPADSENRDRILDWWRAWWRRVFFPWLASFIAALNTWLEAAETYIIAHAISGYSWRVTTTTLDPVVGHTTAAVFVVDESFRPLVVNDLVMDESLANTYGEITAVIDATHATVTTLGTLKGLTGHGWWVTATPISATGTTDVILTAEPDRIPQVNDLVSDESSALRYGIVTVVIDPTHVTVSPLGVLRGLPGFGWWSTTDPITHSGTTAVVLSSGPDRLPQINDLVIDDTASGAYGEITIVTDATHVTVAFVGLLQGPVGPTGDPGPAGDPGVVQTIQPGTGVSVDSTDPANPIVSSDVSGVVTAIDPGTGITVDSTDPTHPIVSAIISDILAGLTGSRNVVIDVTDPLHPVIGVGNAAHKLWIPEYTSLPTFGGAADQIALFNYSAGGTGILFQVNGLGYMRIGHMDGIVPGYGIEFISDGTNGWDYNKPFVRYLMPDQAHPAVTPDAQQVGDFRWNTTIPGPEIWDGTSWRTITIV